MINSVMVHNNFCKYTYFLSFPFEQHTIHALVRFVFLPVTIVSNMWSLSRLSNLKDASL